MTSIPIIAALFVWSEDLIGLRGRQRGRGPAGAVLLFVAPMEALDQVFVSLFAVFSKPRAIFFRKHLMAPGLRFVVVLALWSPAQDVMFLAVGYLLASAGRAPAYVGLLVGLLRERGLWQAFNPREVDPALPRRVRVLGPPHHRGAGAAVDEGGWRDGAGAATTPAIEIAQLSRGVRVARLNTAVTTSFATLFLPVIARLHARGDIDELREQLLAHCHVRRRLHLPDLRAHRAAGPGHHPHPFGPGTPTPRRCCRSSPIGYYLNVMFGLQRLHAAGLWPDPVPGRGEPVHGGLNIGLCFALADELGAVGIAIANCAALTAQNVINQWALRGASAPASSRGVLGLLPAILGGTACSGCWSCRLPGIVLERAGRGRWCRRWSSSAARSRCSWPTPFRSFGGSPCSGAGALTDAGDVVGGRQLAQPGGQVGVAVGAEPAAVCSFDSR